MNIWLVLRRFLRRGKDTTYSDIAKEAEARKLENAKTLDRSRRARERAVRILALETDSYRRKEGRKEA